WPRRSTVDFRPSFSRVRAMSSSPVTLSVIIPVYNEVRTIREVVETVRGVEVPGVKIEIVVVDDGSTDGTIEICEKELASKIDIFAKQPKNGGKGAAIRRGLKE